MSVFEYLFLEPLDLLTEQLDEIHPLRGYKRQTVVVPRKIRTPFFAERSNGTSAEALRAQYPSLSS